MIRNTTSGLALAVMVLCAPLFTGCAASQLQAEVLAEREAENRALREERAGLKNELRTLQFQNESLETALMEAQARRLEAAVAAPVAPTAPASTSFEALDELGIQYGTRDGRMVISIPTEITFGSGKATLSEGGRTALTAVARTLIDEYAQAQYWIEGHTDNDPIAKSKFATNRDLSIARAMAVLHYMVGETGVPDAQCVVAGWGEYRPLRPNDSRDNKGVNRRVEIVVEE